MAKKKPSSAHAGLIVRALSPEDWPTIEALFGRNGACGGCWCMWWRRERGGKLWEQNKGASNKRAFKKLVTTGKVFGCLAFSEDQPVGWCCIGPRADFPRLQRTKGLDTNWGERTWSVTCFFIRSGWRHQGVATALLKEAVEVARANGAKELEAYPVRPKAAGAGDIPAAFAWTGVPRLFEKVKFRNVTPPGNSRAIYRKVFRHRRRPVARATCGTDKARANTSGTTTKALSRALSVSLSRSAHGASNAQHGQGPPGNVIA